MVAFRVLCKIYNVYGNTLLVGSYNTPPFSLASHCNCYYIDGVVLFYWRATGDYVKGEGRGGVS